MANLIQRFSSAMAAGRAATNPPNNMTQKQADRLNAKKYILGIVLGQTLEETTNAAATLTKTANEIGASVILVTDQSDVSFYQVESCITEYLPSSEGLASTQGARAAETYLERRLHILFRKWEPVKTIPFGERSQVMFDFWRAQN